jgi:hypothetical protein
VARKRASSTSIAPKTKKSKGTTRGRNLSTVVPKVQVDSPPYPVKILLAVEDEAEFPVVSQDDCFGCKIPSVYLTLSGSLELMAEPGIPHDDKVQRIRSVADEKFPCMIQPRKLKCLSAG